MLKIKDYRKVIMTRGDDVVISLKIRKPDFPYDFYEIQSEDTCVLSVRKLQGKTEDNPIVMQFVLDNEKFFIPAEITANLDYGTYWYDVQLTLSNGIVNTVIPSSPFIIVTY